MIGYIYNKETRVIITKITHIIACNNTTIKGDGMAVLGTGEYVITDLEYNIGDIFPIDVVDRRSEIAVLPVQ